MKEVLDDFIGVSPQTRIDIDDIARRSRTIRRRRRGVAVCLAGLAVAGLAVAGAAAMPSGNRAGPAPAATKSTKSTKSPGPAEPDRLLAALKAAMTREAPSVTGLGGLKRQVLQCVGHNSGYDYVTVAPGVRAIPCAKPPGEAARLAREYIWFGRLSSPKGTYNVRIFVAPGHYEDPDTPPVNKEDAEERRTAAENGDAPQRGPNGESILVDNSLNMTKPDGTTIMIRTWDVDDSRPGAGIRGPFTPQELTAIGLDPALHL